MLLSQSSSVVKEFPKFQGFISKTVVPNGYYSNLNPRVTSIISINCKNERQGDVGQIIRNVIKDIN